MYLVELAWFSAVRISRQTRIRVEKAADRYWPISRRSHFRIRRHHVIYRNRIDVNPCLSCSRRSSYAHAENLRLKPRWNGSKITNMSTTDCGTIGVLECLKSTSAALIWWILAGIVRNWRWINPCIPETHFTWLLYYFFFRRTIQMPFWELSFFW